MKQSFGGQILDTDEVLDFLVAHYKIIPLGERDRVMQVLRYASRWLSDTTGCGLVYFKALEEHYETYSQGGEGVTKGSLPPYVFECYLALHKASA